MPVFLWKILKSSITKTHQNLQAKKIRDRKVFLFLLFKKKNIISFLNIVAIRLSNGMKRLISALKRTAMASEHDFQSMYCIFFDASLPSKNT